MGKKKKTLSLIAINHLDSNVISHIHSCSISYVAKLIRLFESKDVVTKMCLNNRLHTLKLKRTKVLCIKLSMSRGQLLLIMGHPIVLSLHT
jgi:hypothetical protein